MEQIPPLFLKCILEEAFVEQKKTANYLCSSSMQDELAVPKKTEP